MEESAKNYLDQAGRVRKGEELNIPHLTNFLQTVLPQIEGTPNIKQFKGGASNLTYQLDFPDRSLILRRPPIGKKAKGAHNMQREHDLMQQLRPHYPYVPQMIAYCGDESIIGSEFYVMEKISGLIPRANLPKSLEPTIQEVRAMCKAAVDKLIELHEVDYKAAGFEKYYKGSGYVERQISGWSRRFINAKTPDVPDYKNIMKWLEVNMPKEQQPCIIHNDFRFDNLVYNPKDLSQIIGVLDWEMATVGDPLMDLGGSLAYWVEREDPYCWRLLRRQPTHLKGMFNRDELMDYYLEKRGLSVEQKKYYYIFGLFRLAVIIQQIYYRYYHQQTRNPQFKLFGIGVRMLERFCSLLIKSRSDQLSQYPLEFIDNWKFIGQFALKQFQK